MFVFSSWSCRLANIVALSNSILLRFVTLEYQVHNAAMSVCSRAFAWEPVLAILESLEEQQLQSDLTLVG